MIVTAKDLRFKINMLFNLLDKGEDIIITYRGKEKAKLQHINEKEEKDTSLFGIWKDRNVDVNKTIRELRKGRDFDI